jgi:putative intracellular protease/amidase
MGGWDESRWRRSGSARTCPYGPNGTAGLVIGGGFPEVHAADLSANTALRSHVAALARAGAPILAECAGLLYLARLLDGEPMCGVLDIKAETTADARLPGRGRRHRLRPRPSRDARRSRNRKTNWWEDPRRRAVSFLPTPASSRSPPSCGKNAEPVPRLMTALLTQVTREIIETSAVFD